MIRVVIKVSDMHKLMRLWSTQCEMDKVHNFTEWSMQLIPKVGCCILKGAISLERLDWQYTVSTVIDNNRRDSKLLKLLQQISIQTCNQYVHANATRRRGISQFIDSFLRTSSLCHEDELFSIRERCQINSEQICYRILGKISELNWCVVRWHAHYHRAYKSHIAAKIHSIFIFIQNTGSKQIIYTKRKITNVWLCVSEHFSN